MDGHLHGISSEAETERESPLVSFASCKDTNPIIGALIFMTSGGPSLPPKGLTSKYHYIGCQGLKKRVLGGGGDTVIQSGADTICASDSSVLLLHQPPHLVLPCFSLRITRSLGGRLFGGSNNGSIYRVPLQELPG